MKNIKTDKLRQYLSCLEALKAEKAELEARLEEINGALSGGPIFRQRFGRESRTATGRRRNGLSLREAVTQVTRNRPLTKPEILEAVRRIGYKFSTSDPMNSLNAMLYAPANKFRNKDGRFAVAK
jgi:hypothetical protein